MKCASTCISAIATQELPKGEWDDLIKILSENSANPDLNFRLASIQTLGFLCEDLDPENLNQE